MMNNKLTLAKNTVEGMIKIYENNKEYGWMDKLVIQNARINYLAVGFNKEYNRLEVIGQYEYQNGFKEKVKIAQYDLTEGFGTVWMGDKKKDYVKVHYFQQAIIKYWEQEMDKQGDMFSNGLYEMKNNIEQIKYLQKNQKVEVMEEIEEVEISLDKKYAKQLEKSPNHITTIKIFKEIFANDDVYVGVYDVLADRFNPYYDLGKMMHKKFKELLDATINGELGLGDMDILCTELFRTCGYEHLAKFDTEIKILDFKSRKKYPTYEWFMKENCWDGTRTIVDMEKIYAFEDAGLKVELFEDIEEVLIWNVAEQLEGQIGLDEIEIKEEVEEMKNKEVLDLDENLPLGTIVGFRYDVYENDVLVDKMILTGKIVYISDDFNGKYNVETNDKKTYLVYNSDIVTWERPSKKEIKISITGEGRVEDIETTSVADASKNLVRRIAEIKGERYCNKTWITIDVKEFEQPIEFRVDLIESLHGDVSNVLELIIEEKRRECKYVAENKEKCTWIKDTDKFISAREELIEVLEKYLNPAPTPEPVIEVEEEYIPDCRILMQGGKAVDIVEINAYNQNHSSGLAGTKIIKYAQGFFYNSEIENKLSVDQIKKLRECGFDMDKQVAIAKEIVDEFNKQINEKNNKKLLTLRKVNVIGSEKCEYDIIFAGMNVNGIKKYDKDGEQHEVIKGIDTDGKIYLSSEFEYLRPLIKKRIRKKRGKYK